jgi:hypothetical protein
MNSNEPQSQSQPLTPDLPPTVHVPDAVRPEGEGAREVPEDEDVREEPADERDRDDGGGPGAPEPPD